MLQVPIERADIFRMFNPSAKEREWAEQSKKCGAPKFLEETQGILRDEGRAIVTKRRGWDCRDTVFAPGARLCKVDHERGEKGV